MRRNRTFMATVVLCCSLARADAAELVLEPSQDSYTQSVGFRTNFGSAPDLFLGHGVYWGLGHLRIYAQFGLAGIEGSIVRAELRLYQYETGEAAGGLPCELHRVLTSWGESTITWQTQPSYDPLSYDREPVGDIFHTGWIAWDATALVRQWLDGEHENRGLVLKYGFEVTAGASRYGIFYSSEHAAAAFRPRLVLTFTDPTAARRSTWGRVKALYH